MISDLCLNEWVRRQVLSFGIKIVPFTGVFFAPAQAQGQGQAQAQGQGLGQSQTSAQGSQAVGAGNANDQKAKIDFAARQFREMLNTRIEDDVKKVLVSQLQDGFVNVVSSADLNNEEVAKVWQEYEKLPQVKLQGGSASQKFVEYLFKSFDQGLQSKWVSKISLTLYVATEVTQANLKIAEELLNKKYFSKFGVAPSYQFQRTTPFRAGAGDKGSGDNAALLSQLGELKGVVKLAIDELASLKILVKEKSSASSDNPQKGNNDSKASENSVEKLAAIEKSVDALTTLVKGMNSGNQNAEVPPWRRLILGLEVPIVGTFLALCSLLLAWLLSGRFLTQKRQFNGVLRESFDSLSSSLRKLGSLGQGGGGAVLETTRSKPSPSDGSERAYEVEASGDSEKLRLEAEGAWVELSSRKFSLLCVLKDWLQEGPEGGCAVAARAVSHARPSGCRLFCSRS